MNDQGCLETYPETPCSFSPVAPQGDFKRSHYFALAIVDGHLEFRFNMGSGPAVIRYGCGVV